MNVHQLLATVLVQTLATVVSAITSYPVSWAMNCTPCVAPAKFIRQYTAKRPRWCEDQLIQTRSSPRVGLFKRARGCSSKLPTLSLNILSEVCSLRPLAIEATSEGHLLLRFSVTFIPRT